jgi:hypothetical protein
MKRSVNLILSILLIFAVATCCTAEDTKSKMPATPVGAKPGPGSVNGTVVETMNTGGYTYVQVDTGKDKIWAAAPEFQVKVGDLVTVPTGMLMKNHHSKTLNRTFDQIFFVGKITVAGAEQTTPQVPATAKAGGAPHENIVPDAPGDMDFSGIKKPEGGKTVAELYAEKDELSGKEVSVRGKVVKFSPSIMATNWIHLQDGTGGEGTNDLTVTTDAKVAVGDTVLVKGVLAVDKDFGYGYEYGVIVEKAEVTVE